MTWQISLRQTFLGLVAMIAIAAPASTTLAYEWVVQPANSRIGFEYQGDGTPKSGVFSRFKGTGQFDPDSLSGAELLLTIDTSSIDLNDDLASGFAQSAEWFDSKNHPNVIYRLIDLTPIEGTRYAAMGQLTIRGVERPITSEINLAFDEDLAAAAGSLVIVRADYLLGVGPSAIFVEIGPDVIVSFDLRAARTE